MAELNFDHFYDHLNQMACGTDRKTFYDKQLYIIVF